MIWNRIKRLLVPANQDAPQPDKKAPRAKWLDTPTPWGVPVLDIRPFTQTVTAWSTEEHAANLVSMSGDDGMGFIGVEPSSRRRLAGC